MKYKPLVSVIMSAYNEQEKWIKRAIESIINQSYSNIEILIVLDNPTNIELDRIIQGYKDKDNRIIYIKNNKNEGLVNSLNKAIFHTKGDFVVRMDADDVSTIDRIEKQVEFMIENKNISLLCTKAVFINENDEEIGISKEYKDELTLMNALKYKNDVIHPTWMIRANILKGSYIKGYRNVPYAEDYDFICRLLLNNYRAYQLKENTLYYRVRQNGITQSKFYDQIKMACYISNIYKYDSENGTNSFSYDAINKILTEKESFILRYLKTKKINKLRVYLFKIFNKYGRRMLINTLICRIKYNV